jgi:septal ring factor EnvC (AmiA/AmiB activator)
MKEYMNKTIMILILVVTVVLLIKSFIPERKDDLLKYKLEQLDIQIDSLKKQQIKLLDRIGTYKKEISKIDSTISNIRSSRTTINNFYELKEDSIKGMERKQIILELKKRYKY